MDYSYRPNNRPQPAASPAAATPARAEDAPPANSEMNEAVAEAQAAGVEDPQDVVLYLTLNNTTHERTELPETLAALRKGEREGLGHRELLPVSDPYWAEETEGNVTFDDPSYQYAFGEEGAQRLQFWHGDPSLQSGQVRVGGDVLSLGTSAVDENDPAQIAKVQSDWKRALMTLGMDAEYADRTVTSLLTDGSGNFRRLASGDGATNELIQYAMAMYRSEKGEIDVKDIVFSGHHYEGAAEGETPYAQGIWGEIPGRTDEEPHYDDTDDFFGLQDVGALRTAFPTAYGKVQSVQLAACNTHHLGMTDEAGNTQTTEQFLQGTFENIQMASYWNDYAPKAAYGFETNGEFVLDAMRQQAGNDAAARDARHNPAGLKRAMLDENGVLSPIRMKTNAQSYQGSTRLDGGTGDEINGLRGRNTTEFDEREDLAPHLYTAPTLPVQTPQ